MRLPQRAQQRDDLRLHGHVECAHGLVAHQEFGLQDHCARDGDALALTAAELVRVAPREVLTKSQLRERRARHVCARARIEVRAMHQQRLCDDLPDTHARVEAARGILEDHLQLAVQALPCAARDEPHDGACQSRFAAP